MFQDQGYNFSNLCKVNLSLSSEVPSPILSKESFLDEDLAIETVRKRAQKGEVVVPLSKIHEGKIAIVAYHDEDSDGKLKTGLFWRPKEGFAFSNNYQPKGPPSFEKAAIILVHGEPVVIELNY